MPDTDPHGLLEPAGLIRTAAVTGSSRRAQDEPVEVTGSPDPEWLALLERGRAGGEDGAGAICEAYSRGIQVGLQRAGEVLHAGSAPEPRQTEAPSRAQAVHDQLAAAQPGETFVFEQQPDRLVLVVIGAFNGIIGQQLEPTAAPTNTTERAEDAARRFAGELQRLLDGLAERGIEPAPESPVGTAAVDTALAAYDMLAWDANVAVERLGVQLDRARQALAAEQRRHASTEPAAISTVPQDRTVDGVPEVEQATTSGPGDREPDPREVADHHLMKALGVDRLDQVMPAIERLKAATVEPACRVCGCTQDRACMGGCSWVDLGDPATGRGPLCSVCWVQA